MISAIPHSLLAAGESRRMGSAKALLHYQGQTFIARICNAFLTAGVDELIVVLGARADETESRSTSPSINFVPSSIRAILLVNSPHSWWGLVHFRLKVKPHL